MPAMELMAAMGLAGMEVFRYNRENYEFDQDQRFTRDEVRLKMQVELFNLFREDIRDLVELTTSKMNLYHLVGALFLKMICIFFCEGFFEAAVPPFLLCFYYVSQGCSAVYLLFAVWLSMHASVASHSYSTRLLTRFVRLPIPGSEQINVLNARYADFEKQKGQMLRIPFLKDNNRWQDRPEMESKAAAKAAAAKAAAKAKALPAPVTSPGGTQKVAADYLGKGAFAYGGDQDMLGFEEELLKAVEFRTQRHVQLFRRLQAQWQCYDAYARVCMSLGIRMMLQGTSYYLLSLCWVQVNMPYVASVLAFLFQALALNIATLDIHGVNDLSLIGALPCFCGILALAVAERSLSGDLEPEQKYLLTLMMYPLEVLWFELLHWLASPMGDNGFLPRQFRAVLFMDVYSDLNEMAGLSEEEKRHVDLRRDKVQEALNITRSALRKWEAVPRRWLTLSQYRMRKQVQKSYNATADALVDFMEKNNLPIPTEDDRSWADLPQAMKREDPFAGMVLGPFNFWVSAGVTSKWYWDIEGNFPLARGGVLYDKPPTVKVLDLDAAMSVCKDFKRQVEGITHGFVDEHAVQSDSESETGSHLGHSESTPLTATGRHRDRMNQAAEIEVNRLPWNLVSFITRALQFVWIGLGVMGALRETDAVVMDWQRSYIVEERRLKEELRFEELELDWPLGTFFRPEHLACSREGLLISSSFSHFMLQENSTGTSLKLKDIPSRSQMFCDPWKLCVRAEFPTSGQLLLHVNTTGRNEIHELRWPKTLRFYGGSVLPCAQLDAFASEPSCFLMVLGDEKDKSRLQIAWSRLPSSRRSMEAREMHLNFRNHSIQVAQAQATAQGLEKLAALDVNQGTLSLLFSSGRIEQWKLLGDQPEQVTSLMATWRHSKDDPFRPTALCSLCNTQFRMRVISYVAGHRARSQRPVLMRVVSQND